MLKAGQVLYDNDPATSGEKLKWFAFKDRSQSANAVRGRCRYGSPTSSTTVSRGGLDTRQSHPTTAHVPLLATLSLEYNARAWSFS